MIFLVKLNSVEMPSLLIPGELFFFSSANPDPLLLFLLSSSSSPSSTGSTRLCKVELIWASLNNTNICISEAYVDRPVCRSSSKIGWRHFCLILFQVD